MKPEEVEKELKSRQALVDLNEHRIISQNGKVLRGQCCRCGECCIHVHVPYKQNFNSWCEKLVKQRTRDGVRFLCSIYRIRPVGCALWPEPTDELPEACTFRWEEVS